MLLKLFATLIATMVLAATAHSHTQKFKRLEIGHPWCVETDDTSKPVAVYMTIQNAGAKPDRLVRALTAMADKTELRAGAAPDEEGKAIASIPVGKRGTVNLKRGGPHILLTGVQKQLGAPDSFPMTLIFERAGKVDVEVMVEPAPVLNPAKR